MKERVSREKDYNVNERSPVKQLAKIGELALNMHQCGSPLKGRKREPKVQKMQKKSLFTDSNGNPICFKTHANVGYLFQSHHRKRKR